MAVIPHITEHALDRYIERVRPALDRAAARADLAITLGQGEVVYVAPAWMQGSRHHGAVDYFLVVDDQVAFPVHGGAVKTCIAREATGAEVRWPGEAA